MINKNSLLLLIILLCTIYKASVGQGVLRGKVLDSETKEPLPFASIYLNGTTVGSSSNRSGEFGLNIPRGSFEVVVAYTGYQTIIYPINAQAIPTSIIFKLVPIETDLKEIQVEDSRDPSWYRNLEIFKKNFLGESTISLQTKILNEKSLIMDMDEETGVLRVRAKEPIKIVNNALGYEINYELVEFVYDLPQGSVTYLGYPFFREMETGRRARDRAFQRNRNRAYEGSFQHFLHTLLDSVNLKQAGFEVRPVEKRDTLISMQLGNRVVSRQREEWVLLDSLLSPEQFYFAENNRNFFDFEGMIAVQSPKLRVDPGYRGMGTRLGAVLSFPESIIYLRVRPSEFDENGILIDPLSIMFEGYWGWEKVGNLLPLNFRPSDQN
jgi:hypothetical protein